MIRKNTVHQHLMDLGFMFVKQDRRHKFYSRVEENGNRIEVSVYRTTLVMTHIYITTRTSDGVKIHSRFANLTNKTSLSVIDNAIAEEEIIAA